MSHARIVIDLGFGDAGKGSIVDHFARVHASDLVVRFNGGAQAAHNVVTEAEHHTFRQFGSGTFSGTRTLYARHALFDPMMLLEEARALQQKGVTNATDLFFVEEECVITTIFQQAMNRVRELSRKEGRHGSCGLGIGETASDRDNTPEMVLRVKDLKDAALTYAKLEVLRKKKFEEAVALVHDAKDPKLTADLEMLGDPEYSRAACDAYRNIVTYVHVVDHAKATAMLSTAHAPIFEGAQGILLDQEYGFYPYITRSDVTPQNAIAMCNEAEIAHEVTGLLRAYCVRHGPGPMPTEENFLSEALRDYHNKFDEWQRGFRVGYFDAVLARYAIDVCGKVDNIMITCTDRLPEMGEVKICNEYAPVENADHLAPLSLSEIGKTEKSQQSLQLMRRSPVYHEFVSSSDLCSLEYQWAYAHEVLRLIDRKIPLLGISRGVRSSDKYFV